MVTARGAGDLEMPIRHTTDRPSPEWSDRMRIGCRAAWLVAVPVIVVVASATAGSSETVATHSRVVSHVVPDRPHLGGYWTSRRLSTATPAPRTATRRAGAIAVPAEATAPAVLAKPAAPASPAVTATPFPGLAEVGTIAYTAGGRDHRATASVVTSPRRNLIVTAAHVLFGARNAVFVPEYHNGVKPFGTWVIDKVFYDKRYVENRDQDLDFAFATIKVRNGRTLQSVVGGNGLVTSRGFVNRVRVIGYPSPQYQSPGRDVPVHCSNTTSRFRTYRYQVEFDCDGFPNGTSGSPWILKYDSKTGRGYTNGVIGGYEGGGPNANVSTTSYFDNDIKTLYTAAQAS
jgi:V8-like Glu-specific endopeptidase